MRAQDRSTGQAEAGRGDPIGDLWIEMAGGPVHARVSGRRAPAGRMPVVLVHGQGMSSDYMVPLIRELAGAFPVYAPDQPGFGRSFRPVRALGLAELADFIVEWADAARLPRPALLGNSFGCQICVECVLRHPGRIDRLILQGPTTDPKGRSVARQLARFFVNSRREGSNIQTVISEYRRAGLGRVARVFRDLLRDRLEDKLPQVRVPTLVVRGERDPIVPQDWAEEVARLLPEGRLVVAPGAAHTMNHYAPGQLARLITPFLMEAPGGQTAAGASDA